MGIDPGDLPTGALVGTVGIADCSGEPGDYKRIKRAPKTIETSCGSDQASAVSVVQSVLAFVHHAKSIL